MSDPLSRTMGAIKSAAPDGYFVGGCVRDWLLGRPLKDLDVAVPGQVEEAGRAIGNAVGGVFFWLREAMQVGRVLVRGAESLQIDVVPLAGSLEEDLRRRDFTVNAMAVAAREGLAPEATVIDPTGGRSDLMARRLRLAAPDALERDPLRCLRAYRLRARLGFSFAPGLEVALRAAAPGLRRVSGERTRDELFALLEGEQSAAILADLLSQDLVSPWSAVLSASASASGVLLLEELDRWLSEEAPLLACARDLSSTLGSAVTPPRTRRGLARLAALAVDAGEATRSIGRALALSEDEVRVVTRAVGGAAALAAECPIPGSARLQFAQRWEPGAVEAVLLALARAHGESGSREERHAGHSASLHALLCDLLERRLRPVRPLLTGHEIMAICALAPGPEVGRYLQQVEEQRADGLLHTPEEAQEWLRGQCRPGG